MLGQVVNILSFQPWFIFTRMILHLLRVSNAASPLLLEEYLATRAYFDEVTIRHEYSLLLQAKFRLLGARAQQTILNFIARGPNRNAVG